MLAIKNLTLAYGPRKLIENANLQLYKNQTVGLVGQNGTGKTSLFKLILGLNHADEGECNLPAGTLISYIEQEIADVNQSLVEYVLNAHHIYKEQHTDLPQYYQLQPNAEKLLVNLGFRNEDLNRPLSEFSGGWQMRVNLAKALFCPSDLLLLDEPTNHLDIETVVWLESWLKNYQGLAIIISHDREFLDNVTGYTVHIANQKLTLYNGNYSTFERTRAEQIELEQKSAAKTQARIDHLQSFVDRFKAKATKAKQAQSRMKMIEKLRFSAAVNTERNYSINFLAPDYSSDLLLTIIDGKVGYPDKLLIDKVNLQIFTNDRIGLLGRNGKGKTSLIKSIIDGNSLLAGTVEMNSKIRIGYFAQQTIEVLQDSDTPFSIIHNTNKNMREQEIYNYLGRFGFSAEISKTSVARFSGGEKARLILASIILTKPNILFLDEPTNHLDMQMREELAASLQEFDGAVILVSHDKFLLQSVADDFYLIENHQLKRFDGSLDDYEEYLLTKENTVQAANKPKLAPAPVKEDVAAGFKLASRLRHEIQQAEKQMEKLQLQKDKLTIELEDANRSADIGNMVSINAGLEKAIGELGLIEEKWLELQEQLEQL